MRIVSRIGLTDKKNVYFQLKKGDLDKHKVSWCMAGTVLFKFDFPLQNISAEIIQRLASPVRLSEKNKSLREGMLENACIDEVFIHKMLAHLTLDIGAFSLASDNVFCIKRRNIRAFIYKFVSIPLHNHLFFVVDGCLDNKRYLCIEVHPTRAITYRVVWLGMKEVTEAKWKGATFQIEKAKKFFSLTEEEFYQKISEIPITEGNRERPENEEY